MPTPSTGVINIITRKAGDSQGLYAEGGGGSQLQGFAGVRYGGTLAPDVGFRVYGKYSDNDDEVLASGRRAGDGWHQEQGGFRIDSTASERDELSLHGDFYAAHEGLDSGGAAQASGGNLVGYWSRVFSEQSDLSLQTYIDRTHLVDPIAALTLNDIPLAPAGPLRDDLTTYDVDFQHRFALGERHRLVWGAGYRYTHDVFRNAPSLGLVPNVLDQNRFSAFFQDEILLAAPLSLIVGTKIEHNDYTGFEFEPNVRLRWTIAANHSVWSAISRAARTPSRLDRDLLEPAPPQITILKGNSDYGSEYVTAYELGYKGQIASTMSLAVTTYYNEYRDVRSASFTPVTVVPLFFANNVEGHTSGVELTADWQILDFWSAHAGYDFLQEHLHVRPGQFDLNDALNETADPRHQASLRSSLNLPSNVEVDAALRWIDTLRTNSGPMPGDVPAYFELDTRIGWKVSPRLELALVGQNLLHGRHPEYGFPSPGRVEIERSVYGKIVWRR